jgi:hypothetical protein
MTTHHDRRGYRFSFPVISDATAFATHLPVIQAGQDQHEVIVYAYTGSLENLREQAFEYGGHEMAANTALERPALRWAEVSFDKPIDAARFAKLIEKVGSEVVATHEGLIVTTNATGKDIHRVLDRNTWDGGYRTTKSVEKFDLAAEANEPGRCALTWTQDGDFTTAKGSKGVYRVLSVGDAYTLTVGSMYLGSFSTKEGAKRTAERHEAHVPELAKTRAAEGGKMTPATARAKLAAVGYMIQKTDYDDYRVYPKGNRDPNIGYHTDDLDDAVMTGLHMAGRAVATERPHSEACEVGCEHSETSPGTSTEVRSPTSTKTSTEAYTAGNFTATVTGGAGKGATNVHIHTAREVSPLRWSKRKKLAHGNIERTAPGGYRVYSAGKASKGRVWVASLNGALIGQYVTMDEAMKAATAQHIMSQPPEIRVRPIPSAAPADFVAPSVRPGKMKPLDWHRAKGGGFTAAGCQANYTVEHVNRPRGQGDKPWCLKHNGVDLGYFATASAAKRRAQKHDRGAIGERGAAEANESGIEWVVRCRTEKDAERFDSAMLQALPKRRLVGSYFEKYVMMISDAERPAVQRIIASGQFPGAELGYADQNSYFHPGEPDSYVGRESARAAERAPVLHEELIHERVATAAMPAPGPEIALPWIKITRDAKSYEAIVEVAKKIGPIDSPPKVYEVLNGPMLREDQETFICMILDLHHQLRAVCEVARGERSSVNVPLEEVVRAAINCAGGRYLYAVHGHPTGDSHASKSDRDLLKSIDKAFEPFANMDCIDHVVIGSRECHSVRENKTYRIKAKK